MHLRHYSLRIKISLKSLFNAHWNLFRSKSSMELSQEFHGTFWTTFEQHLWFHGIPWNLSNKTSSSKQFNGILSRPKVPWNSMEFCPDPKFHGIPWNLINFVFKKIIFLNSVFRIWLMIRCYWSKISMIRYILHWFQYRNSYFEHPSFSENGASSAKMACCLLYLQALEKQTEVVTVHLKPNWSRNCSS